MTQSVVFALPKSSRMQPFLKQKRTLEPATATRLRLVMRRTAAATAAAARRQEELEAGFLSEERDEGGKVARLVRILTLSPREPRP